MLNYKLNHFIGLFLLFFFLGVSNSFAASNDEDSLIFMADKHERLLRTSALRFQDDELDNILKTMVCDIAPNDCSRVRIYVLNRSGFNAFMMPNGATFIHSGLLLRATTSSEVAAVVGHEIAHFTMRHSLNRLVDNRSKITTLGVLNKIGGAVGRSDLTTIVNIMGAYSLSSYSRDHERQADKIGFEMVKNAGFNPHSFPKIWENLIAEDESANKGINLFQSHPMPAERITYLKKLAVNYPENRQDVIMEQEIPDLIDKYRLDLLSAEMRSMDADRFERLLENQRKFTSIADGMLDFICAEAWMKNSKKQSTSARQIRKAHENANRCYAAGAESESGMPSEAYRDWGRLSETLADFESASLAYQKYLELEPDAWDAKFVSKKLAKIENKATLNSTTKGTDERALLGKSKLDTAADNCEMLGFKRKTEPFAECAIKLIDLE